MKSRIAASFFIFVLLSSFCFQGSVFANNTKSDYSNSGLITNISPVEIINGRITGEKVGYYFQFPENMPYKNYIVAERSIYGTNQPLLEKVNFYVISDKRMENPELRQLLMSLYAFKKLAWSSTLGLQEIFRTKDYVFAYEKRDESGFTDSYNKMVFSSCLRNLCSLNAIKQCLTLPSGQIVEFDHTVFLNGRALNTKLYKVDGTYMLPFKDICEALGYEVLWDSSKFEITIRKGSYRSSFTMISSSQNVNGYPASRLNGRTYISHLYFINIMRLNFEADINTNVYLTE